MKTAVITEPTPQAAGLSPASDNVAYAVEDAFAVDRLKLVAQPRPQPQTGEVLIRIRAVSLNFRDLDILRGTYPAGKYDLPFVPTSDAAGEVVALGEGVTRFQVGDRVMPSYWQGWPDGDTPPAEAETLGGALPGMLRRYAVIPAANLVRIPEYLTFEEASTLPIAGLTAWSALVTIGRIRPGDTVLVQGTGGVAIFALQIAKLAGARAIVTSSSDAKLERARALGADGLINYRAVPEWAKRVLELTGGRGADHVIEIGGAGTINQAVDALRLGGNVYVIGYLSRGAAGLDPFRVLRKKAHIHGVLVGSQAGFEDMNRAFALGRVKPVIDRVFAWSDVPAAFRHMEAAQHFGKIVIRVE